MTTLRQIGLSPLVPAKAGTQDQITLDSRLRGNERSKGRDQAGAMRLYSFARASTVITSFAVIRVDTCRL
jgi:hypothetical protein